MILNNINRTIKSILPSYVQSLLETAKRSAQKTADAITSLFFDTVNNPKPSLLVEEISFSSLDLNCFLAAKAAEEWTDIADKKELLTQDPAERTQFFDCSNTSAMICGYLKNQILYWNYCVCKDQQGNFQGMMSLKVYDDHVLVSYLVTHPNNIRSSLNDNEPNRVRGVGTCLLKKAEEIAIQAGKKYVKLDSLPSSVGFYQKVGFQCVEEGSWEMVKKVM